MQNYEEYDPMKEIKEILSNDLFEDNKWKKANTVDKIKIIIDQLYLQEEQIKNLEDKIDYLYSEVSRNKSIVYNDFSKGSMILEI